MADPGMTGAVVSTTVNIVRGEAVTASRGMTCFVQAGSKASRLGAAESKLGYRICRDRGVDKKMSFFHDPYVLALFNRFSRIHEHTIPAFSS